MSNKTRPAVVIHGKKSSFVYNEGCLRGSSPGNLFGTLQGLESLDEALVMVRRFEATFLKVNWSAEEELKLLREGK